MDSSDRKRRRVNWRVVHELITLIAWVCVLELVFVIWLVVSMRGIE